MNIEPPRVLVCGWAGAGNIGDELLTREVVELLRARGAVPVVVSRDPAATSRLHGVEAVPWGPRGAGVVRRVDAICVGPGGLFQDTSSLWSLPGNLAVPLLARLARKPIVGVGLGAEPLTRRSSGWLLRRALRGAPLVTRDESSSAALRAVGLEAQTAVDLVFGLEIAAVTRRPEILVAIGPAVGAGALRPAASKLEPVPAADIAAAVDRLAEQLGCAVVFAGFRGDRDRQAAEQVAPLLGADSSLLAADMDAHVEQVAASRLVVASRYHPLVLAARAGTPAIAVSRQVKVASLVAQIDEARPGAAIAASSWGSLADASTIPEPSSPISLDGLEVVATALSRI